MIWIRIFMILIGIIGITLIIYYSNWQTALGIFLLTWFNNFELSGKYIKKVGK